MNYLLLACSALALTGNNICTKLFVRGGGRSPASAYFYNGAYTLVAALLFGALSIGQPAPQTATVLLAAANGVFFAMCLLFSTLAFRLGSMSLSAVIINSAFCVPMIYSFFVWRERFTLLNLAGVALLLVTFWLSSLTGEKDGKKKATSKWIACIAAAFIGGGAGAVFGKQQQKLTEGADKITYMAIVYATATLLFAVMYLIAAKRGEGLSYGANFAMGKGKLAALCISSGLMNGAGNYLIIYLALLLPAVVLYPVANGGLAVLVSVASVAVFGEKLTWQLGTAIAVGVAAILLLTL